MNGTSLHYVRGGKGPALILIHGFPQDWFEYCAIMPQLAQRFTVIAVDLRGVGGPKATPGGYDAANMAEDVYQLVLALSLEGVYIVGHDTGGMVAYAFVRRYPQLLRGAMINFGNFSKGEVADYIQASGTPDAIGAVLRMYRAFSANAALNQTQRDQNDVPLFLGAGHGSSFARLIPRIAEGLRANGLTNVEIGIIPNSVHYLVADQPKAVADLIERYASAR